MLIAAAAIGLLTAYYFGLRPGVIAAGVSLVAFAVALFVPGAMLPAYGVVALGVVAICALGPRFGRPVAKANLLAGLRRSAGWLIKLLRK